MKAKKVIKIVIAVVLLFGIGILIGLIQNMSKVQQTVQPEPQEEYQFLSQKIQPGQNLQQLEKNLGEPVNKTQKDEYLIYEYNSSVSTRNHEIYLEDQEVEFMREIITPKDEVDVNDITKIYGKPKYKFPESASNTGFFLYVYPEEGLAYRGHESGLVLQVWYFKPTEVDAFIEKWAPNYSENPPHTN